MTTTCECESWVRSPVRPPGSTPSMESGDCWVFFCKFAPYRSKCLPPKQDWLTPHMLSSRTRRNLYTLLRMQSESEFFGVPWIFLQPLAIIVLIETSILFQSASGTTLMFVSIAGQMGTFDMTRWRTRFTTWGSLSLLLVQFPPEYNYVYQWELEPCDARMREHRIGYLSVNLSVDRLKYVLSVT